jgi:hypothetical protein
MSIGALAAAAFELADSEPAEPAEVPPTCPDYWLLARSLQPKRVWGSPLNLPATRHSARITRERHLLGTLGIRLIEQAGCHLPDAFLQGAGSWSSLNAQEQRALLRRLCRWIAATYSAQRQPLSLQELQAKHARPYDLRGLFPALWGRGEASPNCLGVTMLLTSFLQQAGCHFRLLSLVELNSTLLSGITGSLHATAKSDIERRYLSLDGRLLEQMQDRIERGQFPAFGLINFHHAVACRCRDGSWFLLDPYAGACGTVPAAWKMESLDITLQQAGRIAPGLSLTTGDQAGYRRFAGREHERLKEAIRYSCQMEEALAPLIEKYGLPEQRLEIGEEDPFDEYLQLAAAQPAWQQLDRLHPANVPGSPYRKAFHREELNGQELRFMLAGLRTEVAPNAAQLQRARQRFKDDSGYRLECVWHLLSRFHLWSIFCSFAGVARVNARHLHPWVEVHADYGHMVGLFVINSLRHARRKGTPTSFLKHTSSQLIAREVLQSHPAAVPDTMLPCLRELPAQHCLLRHTLEKYRPSGEENARDQPGESS